MCKPCRASNELVRREALLRERRDTLPPCAEDGCDRERYVVASQVSSYCHDHHLERRRTLRLKRDYDLTTEAHEALLAGADRRCEICGRQDVRRLVVDHCHVNGHVRGVLCDDCNTGLGRFQDDPALLGAAITYLVRDLAKQRLDYLDRAGVAC